MEGSRDEFLARTAFARDSGPWCHGAAIFSIKLSTDRMARLSPTISGLRSIPGQAGLQVRFSTTVGAMGKRLGERWRAIAGEAEGLSK